MGDRSGHRAARRRRRTARLHAVVRADARAAAALRPADRRLLQRVRRTGLAVLVAGLLWPTGLGVFATVRGWITHPSVPRHGRYRYAQVADHWPDFTAPWPVPVAILLVLLALTLLVLRRRTVLGLALQTLAAAWLGAGGGITFVGAMYLGAAHWPRWQLGLGIPTLVVGVVLWFVDRRREGRLVSGRP